MENKPRTINLRDANQQFSKLVREVEESGQEFVILRNGKEAARLSPVKPISEPVSKDRKLSPEQEAALARVLNFKSHGTPPPGWKFSRKELYGDG